MPPFRDLGFRDLRFRVWGLGFRVSGFRYLEAPRTIQVFLGEGSCLGGQGLGSHYECSRALGQRMPVCLKLGGGGPLP